MAQAINLFVDRNAKQLVASLTSTATVQLPPLYNTNAQSFNVQLQNQASNPVAPYTIANVTGYTLDIVIGPTPNAATPPALLAYADGITPTNNVFSGSLIINTTAVNTFISGASNTAYFEMTLIDGTGLRETLYQGTVLLKAALDTSGTVVPTPAASYLTALQCQAAFALQFGLPGQLFTLVSPAGHYARVLGIDDQGNRIDVIQTIS